MTPKELTAFIEGGISQLSAYDAQRVYDAAYQRLVDLDPDDEDLEPDWVEVDHDGRPLDEEAA